ncbi:DoxX family protein [Streptomyces antimicrobicus]|uniref:DoxX family protein n=1 Tax=Streptomyces antimicrobicus TaxID=2883108 RepID=A0ABS8BB43_9ACTN|nr:DoxX family protein [Streptomyces antimicrobicus]MCB5181849.1 DoxX family protein [Streptomyces antimicrobicus]
MTIPSLQLDRRPAVDTTPYDVGLPVLRLVAGLIMAVHGTQKLFRWFDGPGVKTTGMFFDRAGYPAAETMAVVAGVTETLGGLGLVLGLLTPLSAAAVVGVLINAVAVKWAGDVVGQKGVEFESLLIAAAVTLALTGPGRFALDRFVPVLRHHRAGYGVAALVLGVALAVLVLLVRD